MKDFQVFMGTVSFQNPLNIRQWLLYYPKADNISEMENDTQEKESHN